MGQSAIDAANTGFWNELCGSQLAKTLQIMDASPASLKRFDDWYMAFYPYLYNHIPFKQLRGKDVLEVGLGYGTVAQKIATSGANYTGLDIACGPVAMVNDRLRQIRSSGRAVQGSILEAPFADESFDYAVAIGSLHHTGNLARAIGECRRVLHPGGALIFMVYNAYSYRRFAQAFTATGYHWFRELLGYRGPVIASDNIQRGAYDKNEAGVCAPHTDWISITSLKHLCRDFTSFEACRENIDQGIPFQTIPRDKLLNTRWPALCGLDLYATARK